MSKIENFRLKLTYEDYVGFPDDGNRHEVIDGDHYVTPSPGYYHQTLLMRLAHLLYVQVELAGRGKVLPAPMDVILTPVDIVQPDILVVLEPRTSLIAPRGVEGAPDLVVEILSESTVDRDRHLKKTLYARTGVAEYWIVDPETRTVEQHVLMKGEGRYDLRGRFHDELVAEALPNVSIDLRQIW